MLSASVLWCPICCRNVTMLTVSRAVEAVGASRRTIYRWVEQARVHVKRMPSGRIRICEDSLLGFHRRLGEGSSSSPSDGRVRLALRLIEEQFQDKNLTLDKLSKQLGVSLSHLARLFKKELRVSFRQHLRAVRMKQAGVLLRRSLLSIKEVAASVGYKHVSDFDHHFNMTYGMRPSVYRRVSAKTEAGQMQRDKHQSSISDISEFSAANGKHQLPELP